MKLRQLGLALALGAALAFPPVAAQDAGGQIQALAAQAARAVPRTQRPYDERGWLERFYAPRFYAPAWSAASARRAVAALQDAQAHGLSPADYGAAMLAERVAAAGQSPDPRLDAALTRALLHYMADLRVGRVRSEYHTRLPDPRLEQFDPVEQLRNALASDDLAGRLAAAEPAFPFYGRVKDMLAQYRALAATPAGELPAAARVRPGTRYPGAAQLQARLVQLGDLPPDTPPAPGDAYTDSLAEGVRRFQARHGLDEDGVLGKETIAALNVPLEHRVRQLELTLERLRWLPDFRPGPLIAVNVPAYRLWAIDLGAPAPQAPLEMRVIVGAAVKTPTPLFIGQMSHLEFNPYWNVPRSIAVGEMIPKLSRNPSYLAHNDMELLPTAGGRPTSVVTGAALAGLRSGAWRMRQRPGPKNALGAVKFAMPNPMNIYLHSTSARELFKLTRRDLSHGCIRVEKPAELAHFVLGDQPQWEPGAVEAAMQPGPTRKVNLSAPIPVVLFYATAMVDSDGRPLFPRDVYRRDPRLEQALADHDKAVAAASAQFGRL